MNRDQLKYKIQSVFREVLDNDDLEITPEMTAEDVDGWDSIAHVQLIVALESSFKLSFSTQEIGDLRNIGSFISLIEQKNQQN